MLMARVVRPGAPAGPQTASTWPPWRGAADVAARGQPAEQRLQDRPAGFADRDLVQSHRGGAAAFLVGCGEGDDPDPGGVALGQQVGIQVALGGRDGDHIRAACRGSPRPARRRCGTARPRRIRCGSRPRARRSSDSSGTPIAIVGTVQPFAGRATGTTDIASWFATASSTRGRFRPRHEKLHAVGGAGDQAIGGDHPDHGGGTDEHRGRAEHAVLRSRGPTRGPPPCRRTPTAEARRAR